MAEKGTGDTTGLENILQCQLCHNKLKAPLTLKQCLHSFCISCVEEIPKKTTDGKEGCFCPKCNTFSGKEEIDTHFFVASLVDANNNSSGPELTHKAVMCQQCKQNSKVSGKCLDCKMALCKKCKSSHLNIPMLKGHKIIRLAHDFTEVIDDLMFCPLHQDRVSELNCKACGKVICLMCKATAHESHQTELITTALEGIDSSTAQISKNIDAMKAQIECIKSEIEKTKEDYSSCRLKIDNHLDKFISQVRAMKAKVEDEVTDQERIALSKLNGIKLNLENQLSKANNIINLVAAAKSYYKDVGLLTTMHGGLYEKVITLGEKEQEDIDVKIPEVIFIKSECTSGDIFGGVCFNEERSVTNPSSKIDSFEDMFNTFNQELTIHLPSWANRLSHVDGQIWVPLRNDNSISMYNPQGKLVKSVKTEVKSVIVVRAAHNGDIIAGGNGLYVVSNDWSEWSLIHEGTFSDIALHRNTFIALDYAGKEILIFSYNTSSNLWTEIKNISVENIQKLSVLDTISTCGDAILVAYMAGINILKYGQDGNCTKYKSHQSSLSFSAKDKTGKVLMTNFQNGSLHLLDITSEELSLQNIGDIKCPQLRDVIIDGEKNVWCLRGFKGDFALVKFVMKK